MCIVSNIHDAYIQKWPSVFTGTYAAPFEQEKTALDLFEELVSVARKLDAVLSLPDCESSEKMEWLRLVREKVRQHEIGDIEKRLAP